MSFYDKWKTTEVKTGPTLAWQLANEMAVKAEQLLERQEAMNNERSKARWAKRNRKLNRALDRYLRVYEADACPGCGQYSEGGACCSTQCRKQARYDNE